MSGKTPTEKRSSLNLQNTGKSSQITRLNSLPSYAERNCCQLNIPLHLRKYTKTFKQSEYYYVKIDKYFYKVENDSSLTELEIKMPLVQRHETTQFDTNRLTLLQYSDIYDSMVDDVDDITVTVAFMPSPTPYTGYLNIKIDEFIDKLKKYMITEKIFVVNEQKLAFVWRVITDDGTEKIFSLCIIFTISSESHILINQETKINLRSYVKNIIFTENKPIFRMNLDLMKLGIGGLDDEFNIMFRRAFSSRGLKPSTVKKLGIKHIKGILLFGPPGCGKTLIARKLSKTISSVEPIVVNGPDLLNKFVGQSEENMRKLFEPAEEEYALKGENSDLHVIIFDEIDALCKQRGSIQNGTGVNDSIVNQLLTKFDGVSECNNFIVIGMTNRPDMLDEALKRPGRFELQLEIGLPDECGRQQILGIHTKALSDMNKLESTIDLVKLSQLTKNFTGAEIEGLVNSARSYAITRATNFDGKDGIEIDDAKIIVTEKDFNAALAEIKPKFGLDNSIRDQTSRYGIMIYSDDFKDLYHTMKYDLNNFIKSKNEQMIMYIKGSNGSGRTSLALNIGLITQYPCIKYISGKSVIGMVDSQRANFIKDLFVDAEKSPQSCIIIDDIENIIDWVYTPVLGVPRFSLSVCTTLKSLINYYHKNKRIIILTFNDYTYETLDTLKILPKPNKIYQIPLSNISHTIQHSINIIDQNTDNTYVDIDTSLPIKDYLFEFNQIKQLTKKENIEDSSETSDE
jgi:SpoVK/Ycf46/Vps4 family AAA+-type ATPase